MPQALPKLAAPAKRAIETLQIHSLEDLTQYKEIELERLHGMGPNTMNKLRMALAAAGLSFAK